MAVYIGLLACILGYWRVYWAIGVYIGLLVVYSINTVHLLL